MDISPNELGGVHQEFGVHGWYRLRAGGFQEGRGWGEAPKISDNRGLSVQEV